MKNIYHDADEVTLRFIEVVEYLREECRIPIARIERDLGITPTMIYRQMKNPARGIIRPYWLENLCRVYKVRPVWLIFGVGPKFYKFADLPSYLSKLNNDTIEEQTEFTAE